MLEAKYFITENPKIFEVGQFLQKLQRFASMFTFKQEKIETKIWQKNSKKIEEIEIEILIFGRKQTKCGRYVAGRSA